MGSITCVPTRSKKGRRNDGSLKTRSRGQIVPKSDLGAHYEIVKANQKFDSQSSQLAKEKQSLPQERPLS